RSSPVRPQRHPCPYDAYGMTAVESAAFGCPTVADGGRGVGALALLGGGGCVEVDLEGTIAGGEGGEKLALELAAIIADREGLRRVGEEGRRRALGWDEAACCRRLVAVMMSLSN
ncbi:hypothetical protein THAOC_06408, partial [Thalassiosira oceanica]